MPCWAELEDDDAADGAERLGDAACGIGPAALEVTILPERGQPFAKHIASPRKTLMTEMGALHAMQVCLGVGGLPCADGGRAEGGPPEGGGTTPAACASG